MTTERIAKLRQLQGELRAFADEVEPPKALLLADDSSVSILGNEAGLIRFANEMLEVSSGGAVSTTLSEWLQQDWLPLERIELDPDPKLEPKKSGKAAGVIFVAILVVLVSVFFVGAVTVEGWLSSHIHFHF